jgi:hypothetical protein
MKSLRGWVMVSAQLKESVQVVDNLSKDLNATAAQQVTAILVEAEKAAETNDLKTNHWSYNVPFAGVRYYSY